MSAMDEVESKLKEVEIASDEENNQKENMKSGADIGTADKADKKKRKGKKKSKVVAVKNPEEEKSEASVLQEIEKNQPEAETEDTTGEEAAR